MARAVSVASSLKLLASPCSAIFVEFPPTCLHSISCATPFSTFCSKQEQQRKREREEEEEEEEEEDDGGDYCICEAEFGGAEEVDEVREGGVRIKRRKFGPKLKEKKFKKATAFGLK
uniref:Uncharacterized protein n=1 Tax=Opuntia streptacantha TaxID=393608 RepID=A0A7C9CRP4_OPUST